MLQTMVNIGAKIDDLEVSEVKNVKQLPPASLQQFLKAVKKNTNFTQELPGVVIAEHQVCILSIFVFIPLRFSLVNVVCRECRVTGLSYLNSSLHCLLVGQICEQVLQQLFGHSRKNCR